MKLLLIEDNQEDVEIVRRLARSSSVPVELTVFDNGRAAIDALTSGHAAPDLVLLDINLPGERGTSVLERMKADARLRDIPVIIVSGSEVDEDILQGMRLGAHSHIVKPIQRGDFAWIASSVMRLRPRLAALLGYQVGL